jgi:hypothetical protein
MRKQTTDLAIEHTDEPSPLGHLDSEKIFHRQNESVLLILGAT